MSVRCYLHKYSNIDSEKQENHIVYSTIPSFNVWHDEEFVEKFVPVDKFNEGGGETYLMVDELREALAQPEGTYSPETIEIIKGIIKQAEEIGQAGEGEGLEFICY